MANAVLQAQRVANSFNGVRALVDAALTLHAGEGWTRIVIGALRGLFVAAARAGTVVRPPPFPFMKSIY